MIKGKLYLYEYDGEWAIWLCVGHRGEYGRYKLVMNYNGQSDKVKDSAALFDGTDFTEISEEKVLEIKAKYL